MLRRRLRPQAEAERGPALARSVTPEDECATCGPEKEERRDPRRTNNTTC